MAPLLNNLKSIFTVDYLIQTTYEERRTYAKENFVSVRNVIQVENHFYGPSASSWIARQDCTWTIHTYGCSKKGGGAYTYSINT